MVVPIFGNQLVPTRIRLIFALLFSLAIFPVLPAMVLPDLLSLQSFLLVLKQVLIGVTLGFLLQVFFHIFVMAGQMIAMQMGLGFASMIDPTNGVSVAVVSQFYVLLVTLLFLSFNGHLVIIDVFIEGFYAIPVDKGEVSQSIFWQLAASGSWMLSSALLMALPALTAILIVNFAFGVMTRAAPQLNIFSLGFPFTLVFGIFILWVMFSGFLPQYEKLSAEVFFKLREYLYLR